MADIEIAEVSVTTLAKEMITKPQTIPVSNDLFIEMYFWVFSRNSSGDLGEFERAKFYSPGIENLYGHLRERGL